MEWLAPFLRRAVHEGKNGNKGNRLVPSGTGVSDNFYYLVLCND